MEIKPGSLVKMLHPRKGSSTNRFLVLSVYRYGSVDAAVLLGRDKQSVVFTCTMELSKLKLVEANTDYLDTIRDIFDDDGIWEKEYFLDKIKRGDCLRVSVSHDGLIGTPLYVLEVNRDERRIICLFLRRGMFQVKDFTCYDVAFAENMSGHNIIIDKMSDIIEWLKTGVEPTNIEEEGGGVCYYF